MFQDIALATLAHLVSFTMYGLT